MFKDSYINSRKAIDRLKKEYLEHNGLVVGMDFDDLYTNFVI